MRQVILIPDEDGAGYTVEVPSLPGCISEGDTLRKRSPISKKRLTCILRVCGRTASQYRILEKDLSCKVAAFAK
jgi:hypothetical protein